MAMIEVRGYVNKPSTFMDGKHTRFTLAERQKQGKDKTPVKVFYDVVQWNTPEPPKESSFVSIKGYMDVVTTQKDGKTFKDLKISAQSVDVIGAPTNDGGTKEAANKKATDDDFSDLPF